MLTSGAASLVGLTYAKLTAHLGYAALMRIAAGAWTAALLVFAVAGQWAVLLIVPVLTGIGSGITMPTLTVLVDRPPPPNSAAPPPRCRRPRSSAASSPRLCSPGR